MIISFMNYAACDTFILSQEKNLRRGVQSALFENERLLIASLLDAFVIFLDFFPSYVTVPGVYITLRKLGPLISYVNFLQYIFYYYAKKI